MRTRARAISYMLVALLVTPSITLAQATTEPSNDWASVVTTQPGAKLAVKLKDGRSVEGKLVRASDTILTLSSHNKNTDLNRRDVLKVYRITATSAKKATLIGLGIGVAVGAGLGAAGSCQSDGFIGDCFAPSVIVPVGAVAGAGLGALAGFAIGKTRHKRALIYEARQPYN
jgi:hypothetical protein